MAARDRRECARRHRPPRPGPDPRRERLGLPLDLAREDGYSEVEERLSPRLTLERSLGSLPRHEREAVELRVLDELPYAQVAKRLAIRPAAARLRVSRALRRLSLSVPKEDL